MPSIYAPQTLLQGVCGRAGKGLARPACFAMGPRSTGSDLSGFGQHVPTGTLAERWLSGRKHRTRNAAWAQAHRGFESHPLRHIIIPLCPIPSPQIQHLCGFESDSDSCGSHTVQTAIFANVGKNFMISGMKNTSNEPQKATGKVRRTSFGDGLIRIDQPTGSSSWVCRIQKHGQRHDYGLGGCAKVSLAQARELAREIRSQIELGLDPHFERRKREAVPNFKDAAAKVYEIHSKTWRNGKHHAQWTRTLELYVFPHIGKFRVDQITGPMIRDLLAEIWLAKPETARRVRQRIGVVLDWAYASGYRETEAPMRAITKGLPRQPRRDNHFPAMPYEDVPAFVQRLRERESFSRLALEFAIFTAARSGEVRGATWDEFDLEKGLWTVPIGPPWPSMRSTGNDPTALGQASRWSLGRT